MADKSNELHLAFPLLDLAWVSSPEEIGKLINFCRRLGIDTIQLCLDQVSSDNPLPSDRELKILRAKYLKTTRLLKAAGFWLVLDLPTLLHGYERAEHPFNRMEDIDGVKLESPCPLDQKWRNYICRLFAGFADVGFDWLWPDDDFRMDNHGSRHACYCRNHLKEFDRRYKHRLTRKELLGILQKPLPISRTEEKIKADWFEFKQLSLEEVADDISKAIHQVNPKCGFGGTLSDLGTASLGGRKTLNLLRKMAGKGNRIHARVGCGGYDDYNRIIGLHSVYAGLRQKMLIPSESWIFSEHSIWPANRFTRSAADFIFQMVHAVSHGYKHLLLFPNIREDAVYQEQIQQHLPFLKNLSRIIPRETIPSGVSLVYTEKCSFYQGIQENRPETGFLAYEFLSRLGIPVRLVETSQVDEAPGPFIIPGNAVMSVADKIPCLMKKGVLLDGEAVELLAAHGRLSALGVEAGTPITSARYEYFNSGLLNGSVKPGVYDFPLFIYRDLKSQPLVRFIPKDRKWQALSEFHGKDRNVLGPDMLVKSDKNGRLALSASSFRHGRELLNYSRKSQYDSLLEWLGNRPLSVRLPGSVDLQPVVMESDGNLVIGLFNFSRDDAEKITLEFPARGKSPKIRTLTSPEGRLEEISNCRIEKKKPYFRVTLPKVFRVSAGKWSIILVTHQE